MAEQRIRRNIHTYPFKYQHLDPESFFAPHDGVIYIHIPFCSTKCHFCDYVVYTNTTLDLRQVYVDALCKEIRQFPENPRFPGFQIDAIYIGGGTPGLLEAAQLIRILDTCRETFPLLDGCEIAVEFDPGCVEYEKVAALREAGFTRLSIGVQSFDAQMLENNNRPHRLEDVYRAWDAIQRAGYQHTNIDLIYPLVGLDMKTWEDSVKKAIDLAPSCITAYPLEVWPKTAYHHWLTSNKKTLPPVEVEVAMCRTALDMLEDAGYRRGSTSGYYHPERHPWYCRFLDYYWRTWPMLGFGVSSKSVIHDRLWTNVRAIRDYVDRVEAGQPLLDFATIMTREQEMRRVMIRGLKMCEVSKADFHHRFGIPMESVFGPEIASLKERGYLNEDPERIYLSREGQVFGSNVYETFYTEDDLRAPVGDEVQFGISDLMLAS